MNVAAASANPRRAPSLWWSRLAAALLRRSAPARPSASPQGGRALDREAIVGAKKRAVYADQRGNLRVIEFFLPTDVLADMRQPIDIRFLEGEERVRADQLQVAIRINFAGFEL
jgi:hypothetical protein